LRRIRSPRPTSSSWDSNMSAALLTSGARCRVFASSRKAARANRIIQGDIAITRRSGMSSTPPNATNSLQKLNSSGGEGSGCNCSVAMCPTLPNDAPAVAGSARSISSTRRPAFVSAQLTAHPMTPAPTTATSTPAPDPPRALSVTHHPHGRQCKFQRHRAHRRQRPDKTQRHRGHRPPEQFSALCPPLSPKTGARAS
jgi:hypothetical protein